MGNVSFTTKELAELRELWVNGHSKYRTQETRVANARFTLDLAKGKHSDADPLDFLNGINAAKRALAETEGELQLTKDGLLEQFDRQGFVPTD
jgi:hypothetical protein